MNVYVLPTIVQSQSGTCELDRIRNYFLTILDMMIQYDTFIETTTHLQSILQTVQPQVEYYRILNIIEHNLLSVAINVSDSVNPKLIQQRIQYIQSMIRTMPPVCQEEGPISVPILQVIELILDSVNFDGITSNIQSIHTYLTHKYKNQSQIELIQTNMINIIDSIRNGTNTKLIHMRIDFVKNLIGSIQSSA